MRKLVAFILAIIHLAMICLASANAQVPLTGAGLGEPGGGFTPGVDPNWYQRFQYNGVVPNVALDFQNGLYWNGSTTLTSPSTMVGGTLTITPGTGLICNSASISAAGSLLSVLEGNAYAVQIQAGNGTSSAAGILADSNINLLFANGTGNVFTFRDSDSAELAENADPTHTFYASMGNSISPAARQFSALGNTLDAGAASNDANNYTASTSNQICGWQGNATFNFLGNIASLAAWNALLPDQVIPPPALTGVNGIWWAGSNSNSISYGSILTQEYTQPFTLVSGQLCIQAAGGGTSGVTGVMQTNVPNGTGNPAFPGYEFWIEGDGFPILKLIHDVGTNEASIYAATNFCDGKYHYFVGTNSGSGLASGLSIYVDGVLQTPTTLFDTLDSLSIISTVGGFPNEYVLNGQTGLTFATPGAMGFFRQYNRVLSLTEIQEFQIDNKIPPCGTCVLSPKFSEGTGTTTGDNSSNGFTGTLNSSAMWLRGTSP